MGLAEWKTNCLSMERRVILAKSVISALHDMQSVQIPRFICYEIEKNQKNFISRVMPLS